MNDAMKAMLRATLTLIGFIVVCCRKLCGVAQEKE